LLERFGGEAKPRHTLGDKTTKQEWTEFEKNNGTYASSYKETLNKQDMMNWLYQQKMKKLV
jgi:hypothetical protein